MAASARPSRGSTASDAGFTLVEVIVALALIGIVASAALIFFVHGTRTITSTQRSQGAVAVANQAMEDAYSRVATASVLGVSGMVVGRTQAEVTAAWTSAASAGLAGLSDSYPAWDTATAPAPATGTSDDAVKLTQTVTESHIPYTVTTLIGQCYRQKNAPTGSCTQAGGTAAGVADSGYTKLMRSIVVVSWADLTGTCSGANKTCTYSIAALMDPSTDLQWNNTTAMLSADDSVNVNAGSSVVVRVLDNDTLPALTGGNPLTLGTSPQKGGTGIAVGTATLDASTGFVTYNAPDWAHGEVTFPYTVTLGARVTSALVHAWVKPHAADLAYAATYGAPLTMTITQSRDTTNPTAISSVAHQSNPGAGSVADVSSTSNKMIYTPPGSGAGTVSFQYTYKDADGMLSLPGTITITNYSTAGINDVAKDVPGNSVDYALNMQAATSNATTYGVIVWNAPSGGSALKLDGTALSSFPSAAGSNLTFTPPANTVGTYTFPFKMQNPAGAQTTAQKTTTIRVTPVGLPDTYSGTTAYAKNTSVNLPIGLNDTYKGGTKVTFGAVTCGTGTATLAFDQSTWTNNGTVKMTLPNSVTTCTFKYKVAMSDGTLPTADITVSVATK